MKKLIIVSLLVSILLMGCATTGSHSNDSNYTQKNLQVVEKTVEQNIWDIFKTGLGVLGQAILFNNYILHP